MGDSSRIRRFRAAFLARLRASRVGILLLVVIVELGIVALAWTTVVFLRVGRATAVPVGLSVLAGIAVLGAGLLIAWSLVRRRFRFGLKELLAATFVAAAVTSWVGPEVLRGHRQGRAVARFSALGARVSFEPFGPPRSWFRRILGDTIAGRVDRVRFPPGTMMTDADLALIGNLTDIKSLELPGSHITDNGLAQLRLPWNLEWLNLNGSTIGDPGSENLARLPQLRYLDLSGTQVTDLTLERLCQSTSLEELRLGNTLVTGSGLRALKDSKRLGSLWLNHSPLANDAIPDFEGCGAVKWIELSDTPLMDTGLDRLARGLGSDIRGLKLARTHITDASAQRLSTFARLAELDLAGTRISDAALSELCRSKTLTDLGLNQTQVTDAGLAHLRQMRGLVSLSLAKTSVGDSGLRYLSGMVSLRNLDLSGTQVTAAGISHLATLPAVDNLDLSDSRVTDEHLENLLLVRSSFLRCYLNGTKVSDAGLKALVDARASVGDKRLPQAMFIELKRSLVTPAGMQALRRAIPNWHIE